VRRERVRRMRICEKISWMGEGRREGEGGRLAAAPAQDLALEEEVLDRGSAAGFAGRVLQAACKPCECEVARA